jgi:hypothetical protein
MREIFSPPNPGNFELRVSPVTSQPSFEEKKNTPNTLDEICSGIRTHDKRI